MTIFKEKMLQDMKLKNFSSRTQDCYLKHIDHFEKFFYSLIQTDIIEYIRLSTDQLIEKLGLDINKCPVCGCKNFSKAPFSRTKSPPSLKKYQLNNN